MAQRAAAVFGDPATWVALAGVIVAGSGLWITFPEAVDRWQDWFTERGRTAKHRAWELIAVLPGVPRPPDNTGLGVEMDQPITGRISGSVDVETTMAGRVSTWRTASSTHERVERLHRMHLKLVKRVDDNRRQARAEIKEAVTDEAKERQTADQQLTRRIADVEEALKIAAEEQVEINTAGLPVVFAGIVLTALPDIVAIFSWWSAIPVVAGVVAWLLVLARSIVGSLKEQEA